MLVNLNKQTKGSVILPCLWAANSLNFAFPVTHKQASTLKSPALACHCCLGKPKNQYCTRLQIHSRCPPEAWSTGIWTESFLSSQIYTPAAPCSGLSRAAMSNTPSATCNPTHFSLKEVPRRSTGSDVIKLETHCKYFNSSIKLPVADLKTPILNCQLRYVTLRGFLESWILGMC